MLNKEPYPIALDHEIPVDMDHLFHKCLFGDEDTPAVLRVSDRSSLIIDKVLAAIPPVDMKTYFNGSTPLSSYWFRLTLTCGELYEKLVLENDPECMRKLYVNVVLGKGGYRVTIQSTHSTIHDAEY